jgi:putative membrane protein
MEKRKVRGTRPGRSIWANAALTALLVIGLGACRSMADAALEGFGDEMYTDQEILHTFITINQGEVITSRPVDESVTGPARAFAQRMIQEHSAVIEQAQALADQQDLTPQPNLVSVTLTNSAEGTAERLEDMNGMPLAMEYMQAQVTMHQNALNMLDHTLIPNAGNSALRGLLQQARQSVAMHLEDAMEIHHEMMDAM